MGVKSPEGELAMETKLISAGIDYNRITTQNMRRAGNLEDAFWRIAMRDRQLGYDVVPGGAFGFVGKKTRHALFGRKKDWAMLQVSGYEAKATGVLALEGTQSTRLDLQLTVFVGALAVESIIFDAYADACDHKRAKARPIEVTLIEKRRRAQTVYLGSRSSDVYCRIYDKHAESGKEEYVGAVRYEVEFKGRMSKAIWASLVAGETTLRQQLEMVIKIFEERGVKIPLDDLDRMDVVIPKPEQTSKENTLAWLSRQVAPTVSKLTAEYGYILPFRILFEQALTDLRTHRIMRLLSVVWGS
jgi:hypothetical protein